ncbi:unnamed protein product, partial [Amoebophrya sp. A25]
GLLDADWLHGVLVSPFYYLAAVVKSAEYWTQNAYYNAGGSTVSRVGSDVYYGAVNVGKAGTTALGIAAWAERATGWSMKTGRWRKINK